MPLGLRQISLNGFEIPSDKTIRLKEDIGTPCLVPRRCLWTRASPQDLKADPGPRCNDDISGDGAAWLSRSPSPIQDRRDSEQKGVPERETLSDANTRVSESSIDLAGCLCTSIASG